MWEFLSKLLTYLMHGLKDEIQRILEGQAQINSELQSLRSVIMSSQDKLQEMATQIGALKDQIASSIENIANDIQALTGKLANAVTPEKVQEILQPQLDALAALAAAAKTTADIVPDAPVDPPTEL
jgi:methyl-accepting chemotaxis protein